MFEGYSLPHIINIAVHVLAGTTAIVSGTVAILSVKGARAATIFPRWAPWSALVPVFIGEAITIYFLFLYRSSRALPAW